MKSSEQDAARAKLLSQLSPSQRTYFDQIAAISAQIQQILQNHPELDWHDLRHILERMALTPRERLSLGLRRRVISHGV